MDVFLLTPQEKAKFILPSVICMALSMILIYIMIIVEIVALSYNISGWSFDSQVMTVGMIIYAGKCCVTYVNDVKCIC